MTCSAPKFTFDTRYYNGKIYQLKHTDADVDQCLYVGHTFMPLRKRLWCHRGKGAPSNRITKLKAYLNEHGRGGLSIELRRIPLL